MAYVHVRHSTTGVLGGEAVARGRTRRVECLRFVMASKATPRLGVEGAIAELVQRQVGVISHRQLVSCGLEPAAIGYRARAGRLFRVHRGVYALSSAPLATRGGWIAAHLACGADSLLSHRTASAAWGLSTDRGLPDVTVVAAKARSHPAIATHRARSLRPQDITSRDGIPLTAVPRTLLDCAATEPRRTLRRMVEEADRLGLLQIEPTLLLLEEIRGHLGIGPLRSEIAQYSGAAPTRSELEDRCLDLLREHGLPAPLVNAAVAGWEVDLYWPRARLAVELDGQTFHRGRAQTRRDHRKEEALDGAGIALRRFDWWQVTRQGPTVARAIRRGLERGAPAEPASA